MFTGWRVDVFPRKLNLKDVKFFFLGGGEPDGMLACEVESNLTRWHVNLLQSHEIWPNSVLIVDVVLTCEHGCTIA